MSYFRSYFNKNNTIIKNSQSNTAKNPNTEIFYGSSHSKFLFRVDIDTLKSKIDNGDLVLNANTKHYLHLTNTIFGDESLLNQDNPSQRKRATSFDLIVFSIPEFWDEGVGFDYTQSYDFAAGNNTYDVRPSNWYNRTTLDKWNTDGVYVGTPDEVIATVHFDNGNEDVHVDVTDYVNSLLDGTNVNYGMGIAFSPNYIDISNETDQSVAFFTKYTQTFFEPYLESVFDDIILDNRDNFISDIEGNLYLYVTKGTNYYDLDELPTVDILNSTQQVIVGLGDLEAVKVRKGIYKVNFGISGILCDGKRFFYDKWKNLSINGVSVNDVTQKFIPKKKEAQFTIGENPTELDRYVIQFFGVKLNEKIKRGENRKIVVNFRSINKQIAPVFEDVYYRIYIKEGRTQVNVFDWTRLDKTNENSFILNTEFMIPREYWIEIKAKTHTEEIFYRDEIKFEIISEK